MVYDNETFNIRLIDIITKETSLRKLLSTNSSSIYAIFCSGLVGLSGLFPIFLFSIIKLKSSHLKFMLSYGCGGLLGDVFIHLLPEAYSKENFSHISTGLWVLLGILTFVIIEIIYNSLTSSKGSILKINSSSVKLSGYLNLVANCIDNFTHGLAIGGAFLIDKKTGVVTTLCILCHEIPHEIGDFAILMKSGFNKYDAAQAQFFTAFLGIIGSTLALTLNCLNAMETYTSWIIPFTSGGFLNISLITILPDLIKSNTFQDTFYLFSGMFLGIFTMFLVIHV